MLVRMIQKEFDIVIFGATGYTGKYCIEWLYNCLNNESKKYKWAIAGRNREALFEARTELESLLGIDLSSIEIIIADVKNEESLFNMTKRCRMLINCVGPYALYGEPVVKACIKTSTHQVDLAGEPQYLEKMQYLYHVEAENAGCYLIQACGFDSIPADVGMNFIRDKFEPGHLNSVDTYARIIQGPAGNKINHGTWDSAINAIGDFGEMGRVRKQLYNKMFPKKWPKFTFKKSQKFYPFKDPVNGRWTIPFWETDMLVNKRSQLFALNKLDEKPIQLTSYLTLPSIAYLFGLMIFGLIFLPMAFFRFGRTLLHDYPGIFSFGMVSKEGPTRKQVQESSFEMILVGEGWMDTKSKDLPPNHKIVGIVKGPNVAYVATSILIIQAALTVLEEIDKIPSTGGILTPGYAFRNTNIIERCNRNNVTFEIVQK